MSAKEYLKMSDAFVHNDVASLEQHIYAGYMSMHACEYAAHAIDSHDELVAENERLLELLEQQRDELLAALQGMIDIASDSQGVAGYHLNGEVAGWDEFAEWQAACDAIAKAKGGSVNHFPGAAKMVTHEGWQLVPVEPTIEMVQAATNSAVGFGTRAAYQAMLSAAPKHEGGAS